jgi:DNA modification methylase
MNINRNFIGIEMDENYYKISEERIKNAVPPQQLAQDPSTPLLDALY